MDMVIEKGVPLPIHAFRGKLQKTLGAMEVGDSILLPPDTNVNYLAARMSEVSKGLRMKFTRRKMSDGHRVWRIA